MRATLVCALLLAVAAAAAGQDAPRVANDAVTWMENGAKKSRTGVFVESTSYDQVAFSQGSRRTTVPAADVVEIRWGDAPREYEAAVAAARAGDFDAARAGFDACLAARATQRGWLVEYGSLGLAESLLALAGRDDRNAEKAAHAFGTAREANPRSMALDRILGGLSKADLPLGRKDAALAAADDLVAAGRAARRPLWECEGLILRIDASDSAAAVRAADDARAAADAAEKAAKDPELARRLRLFSRRAMARKAWSLVTQAISIARGVSHPVGAQRMEAESLIAFVRQDTPIDSETEASMLNAEGALLLADENARAALRKFLEVEVLHFDAPDEAAEALWREAACHERLGNAAARADALKRLAETYPNSVWTRRAR